MNTSKRLCAELLESRQLLAADLLALVAAAPGTTLSSRPENFIAAGDFVYFDALQRDGVDVTRNIYRTDGTAEGTVPVIRDARVGDDVITLGNRLLIDSGSQLRKRPLSC